MAGEGDTFVNSDDGADLLEPKLFRRNVEDALAPVVAGALRALVAAVVGRRAAAARELALNAILVAGGLAVLIASLLVSRRGSAAADDVGGEGVRAVHVAQLVAAGAARRHQRWVDERRVVECEEGVGLLLTASRGASLRGARALRRCLLLLSAVVALNFLSGHEIIQKVRVEEDKRRKTDARAAVVHAALVAGLLRVVAVAAEQIGALRLLVRVHATAPANLLVIVVAAALRHVIITRGRAAGGVAGADAEAGAGSSSGGGGRCVGGVTKEAFRDRAAGRGEEAAGGGSGSRASRGGAHAVVAEALHRGGRGAAVVGGLVGAINIKVSIFILFLGRRRGVGSAANRLHPLATDDARRVLGAVVGVPDGAPLGVEDRLLLDEAHRATLLVERALHLAVYGRRGAGGEGGGRDVRQRDGADGDGRALAVHFDLFSLVQCQMLFAKMRLNLSYAVPSLGSNFRLLNSFCSEWLGEQMAGAREDNYTMEQTYQNRKQ